MENYKEINSVHVCTSGTFEKYYYAHTNMDTKIRNKFQFYLTKVKFTIN